MTRAPPATLRSSRRPGRAPTPAGETAAGTTALTAAAVLTTSLLAARAPAAPAPAAPPPTPPALAAPSPAAREATPLPPRLSVPTNVPAELALTASGSYRDPFHEVAVDVLFHDPRGTARRVPAYWAGGNTWKVRYASPLPGTHRFRTTASEESDRGLHGVEGSVQIEPYQGDNPLYRHGPIRVAPDRRHFEHADGTPFFWLGDTWWMGLCHRLRWPEEFQHLAADRKAKGFTVVQIVAGLYPDMPPFDPRGANEAGFPWEEGYRCIRPHYFDAADRRIHHLVESGLVPCLVGAWGYFLPWMGVEKAKEHWRYLIARYGAWPVVWCAAGEANLPYYLVAGFPFEDRDQVRGWTEVMRYLRETDPFRRPLSIHPTGLGKLSARGATDDPSLLDFDMLQTGHGGPEVLAPSIRALRASLAAAPVMPVLNSEVSYEALLDRVPARVVRLVFWASLLSGAAGHTYGANGIWQVNRRGQPHGASPHGANYGSIPWDEAMRLPGSRQVGRGKGLLEELPWHRFEPHPEWAAWREAPEPQPWGEWIWFPEGDAEHDAPVAVRFFRRRFTLPAGVSVAGASLLVAADDRFTAWVNGSEVGSGGGWRAPARFDVRARIEPGVNVLALRVENAPAPVAQNPAGLNASLEVETGAAEGPLRIVTDASWRAAREAGEGWLDAKYDDSGWHPAAVTARAGEGPWGPLGGDDAALVPYAAGIPGEVRVIYAPEPRDVTMRGLAPGVEWRAAYFDPVSGERAAGEPVAAAFGGEWHACAPAHGHDWVVVLLAARAGTGAAPAAPAAPSDPKREGG